MRQALDSTSCRSRFARRLGLDEMRRYSRAFAPDELLGAVSSTTRYGMRFSRKIVQANFFGISHFVISGDRGLSVA